MYNQRSEVKSQAGEVYSRVTGFRLNHRMSVSTSWAKSPFLFLVTGYDLNMDQGS